MKMEFANQIFLIFCVWVIRSVNAAKGVPKDIVLCANSGGYIAHLDEDGGSEDVSTESPYQKCVNNCYTLWREDPINGTLTIMGQGCWDTSGNPNECGRAECLADKKPPKAMNNTKFCCCSKNMCNVNFTDAYVPAEDIPPPESKTAPKKSINSLIWIAVVVAFVAIVVVLFGIPYYIWKKKPKKNDLETGHQYPLPPMKEYDLDKLDMINIIGSGRYGFVWRGMIEDQEFAVKVFSGHNRNLFLNELEMYKISGDNSALLKCYGGGEFVIAAGAPPDYVLLFSLEQESLQEFLKNHTLDLIALCKMSLGVAKGLAHLHTDLAKPSIAHRDLNTRNILVRSDLSCCLCDLGLAVAPRQAEKKSISEAGTLRYMAPEVLEGAVNLRECESALKQIDVYALGLVLWELGTRCSDMQNSEPASYSLPFFKEAGERPTLEQMQTLVSRHKARPLWPTSWKDTAAARLLCETSEDCWDQDAEARLTSLCVVERLQELPTLKGRVLYSHHPPASPTPLINNNHLHDHQHDASVGTVETLLSPSEENCKNSNQLAACVTPLQPYQGRNPCLERNLHSGSSDSLLIDKSSKHCCTSSESQNLIPNDYLNFQINYRAMPIPYLQNAVHGSPKQQNTNAEASKAKFKWRIFMKFFQNRKNEGGDSACRETQVKLNTKLVNGFGQNGVTTSLLAGNENKRPSTLPLIVKSQDNALNTSGVAQIMKQKNSLSRQRSLEQFNEVFSSTNDLSRLKDPSLRIKTPGDVPPSVRRTRGKAARDSARFSLYDDRMMAHGQWGSAPHLESPVPLQQPQFNDLQDKDSVSSF